MESRESLATVQRSLADQSIEYPLRLPITTGCPETSTPEIQYPLEVDYSYDDLEPGLFDPPLAAGLGRWQPLLPPLTEETALGEGNTPLVELPELADCLGYDGDLYLKDESRNPTWSHKDRLNRCTVSAAVDSGDRGVVASSSGNHGASAAAYAARAGLPCVVLTAPDTPPAVQAFLASYGAAVVRVEGIEAREEAVDRLAADHGFHPASSRTPVHTGHPFGPEGYKTIAYELFVGLGRRVPGTLFVPTGFAELLYGVWKGFRELHELEIAAKTPQMVACEPAARAPLAEAVERGEEVAEVAAEPTPADAIEVTTSSYRGLCAIEESDGYASPVAAETLYEGQRLLAERGFWQEVSGAAGVAGLQAALDRGEPVDSPAVCLGTSSGFKDGESVSVPEADPDWTDVRETLGSEYGLVL